MKCIGFGEHEGKCDGVAGTRTGKWWCESCEKLRLDHLNKCFKELESRFKKRTTCLVNLPRSRNDQ